MRGLTLLYIAALLVLWPAVTRGLGWSFPQFLLLAVALGIVRVAVQAVLLKRARRRDPDGSRS